MTSFASAMRCFYHHRLTAVLGVMGVLIVLMQVAGAIQMPAWDSSGQTSDTGPSTDVDQQDVYKAGVSIVKQLPPAMYGVWSIQARILKTNDATLAPMSTEIWELARDVNTVTIENIVNQARATITVDDVEGNTATFHREFKAPNGRFRITEIPTVTVDGNFLTGTNHQKYTYYFRDGTVRAEYFVEAELRGTRLANETVQFKGGFNPPNFEVEPLKVLH